MATIYSHGEGRSPDHAAEFCRLEIPRSAIERLLTPEERHKWIAEAAYFMAEGRGFAPGHEVSDWLAAETEVSRVCGLIEPLPRWDP
jgi:hypothetical protein